MARPLLMVQAAAPGHVVAGSAFDTPEPSRPNLPVILIDDLRFDEFGTGGRPYMRTPPIDRLAREGGPFRRAFHTTPICGPNRASIMTGQYAGRHGIIDNAARDAMSHHLALRALRYETPHLGKWHMGNHSMPRPAYDHWFSFDGHGRNEDPASSVNDTYRRFDGYVSDILTARALAFVERHGDRPCDKRFAMALAHKAVHPDAEQAADGTPRFVGYLTDGRHRDLYRGELSPRRPLRVDQPGRRPRTRTGAGAVAPAPACTGGRRPAL